MHGRPSSIQRVILFSKLSLSRLFNYFWPFSSSLFCHWCRSNSPSPYIFYIYMYIHLYVSVNPFSPRLSLSLSLSFLSSLPRLLRSFLSRRFFFLPPCQSSPSVSVSLFPHFYLSLYATSFPSFVSFESVSHCWCVRVCVSVRVCASTRACDWLCARAL